MTETPEDDLYYTSHEQTYASDVTHIAIIKVL